MFDLENALPCACATRPANDGTSFLNLTPRGRSSGSGFSIVPSRTPPPRREVPLLSTGESLRFGLWKFNTGHYAKFRRLDLRIILGYVGNRECNVKSRLQRDMNVIMKKMYIRSLPPNHDDPRGHTSGSI